MLKYKFSLMLLLVSMFFSMLPSIGESNELSSYVSIESEALDDGRKYSVLLEKGTTYYSPQGAVVNDSFQDIKKLGTFISPCGLSFSVMQVFPHYEISVRYIIDMLIEKNNLKKGSLTKVRHSDYLAYQVEAFSDDSDLVFSGFRDGDSYFLVIAGCFNSNNKECNEKRKVALRSFKLTKYNDAKPIEERKNISLGESSIATSIPSSWEVKNIENTPEGISVVHLFLKDDEKNISSIQLKCISKSKYKKVDQEKVFSMIKKELSATGKKIIKNHAVTNISNDLFKGKLEAHMLTDEKEVKYFLVASAMESEEFWIGITGYSPTKQNHPVIWSVFNTSMNILISNLNINN